MILPTTASAVWIVAIVSLLCLGSWINALKLAGKWRFEYFYGDFVFGALLSAGIAALALGSTHPQELTFQDNLLLTGYRKMAWAFGSGVVVGLGTLLMLGAMTISGMAVAFPLSFGVALAIGTLWDLTASERASTVLMLAGTALFLAAVAVIALAHVWRRQDYQATSETALRPDPRLKPKRSRTSGPALAIVLAIAGGVVLGFFPPVLGQATGGENGLAPYSAALLLAAGTFFSAPLFVLFAATFPVAGAAVTVRGYLDGSKGQHLLGIAGGALWTTGMLGSLMVAAVPAGAQFSGTAQYLLGHVLSQAALLVAAAWGLLVWREFRGTTTRVHMLVATTLVLFIAGLGVIAFGFK